MLSTWISTQNHNTEASTTDHTMHGYIKSAGESGFLPMQPAIALS